MSTSKAQLIMNQARGVVNEFRLNHEELEKKCKELSDIKMSQHCEEEGGQVVKYIYCFSDNSEIILKKQNGIIIRIYCN